MPLFVERNIPLTSVPAKMFAPEIKSEVTLILANPLSAVFQLLPLLVDLNTPPCKVPAKRLVPKDKIERTF